jgi:hypothetical protein
VLLAAFGTTYHDTAPRFFVLDPDGRQRLDSLTDGSARMDA